MQNENINSLVAVKQRIDARRAELEAELKDLEAAKERYAAGIYEKPIEEINYNIGLVKAELAKPYYADSEYRQLSIASMEAITANYAADLAANETAIAAAETALATAKENLAKAKEQTEDIRSAVIVKLNNVGLGGVIPEAVHCPPEHLNAKYKDICSKYN